MHANPTAAVLHAGAAEARIAEQIAFSRVPAVSYKRLATQAITDCGTASTCVTASRKRDASAKKWILRWV